MTVFLFKKDEIIVAEVQFIEHQLILEKKLNFMEIESYYFS